MIIDRVSRWECYTISTTTKGNEPNRREYIESEKQCEYLSLIPLYLYLSQVLLAVSSAWADAADVSLSVVLVPISIYSRPIPLSSSPSSSLPASVIIKIQPMTNAGGHQNVGGMGTRTGALPM